MAVGPSPPLDSSRRPCGVRWVADVLSDIFRPGLRVFCEIAAGRGRPRQGRARNKVEAGPDLRSARLKSRSTSSDLLHDGGFSAADGCGAGPRSDRDLADGRRRSYGLDATFQGASGYERAERHADGLKRGRVRYSLRQELSGGWTLRFGPLSAAEVGTALGAFVC
jgi:hypothetical protein